MQQVQADPKDLARLTQLQVTQTLGRKKYLNENYTCLQPEQNTEKEERVVSAVKGRKRKQPPGEEVDRQEGQADPNIVRLGVRH